MVTLLPRDGIHFSTGGEPLFRAMGTPGHTKELGHTKGLDILILVTCSGTPSHDVEGTLVSMRPGMRDGWWKSCGRAGTGRMGRGRVFGSA